MTTQAERLLNGQPRYTVVAHEPLSRRRGCWTYTVNDRATGRVVYGPTTISREAGAACEFLSCPADVVTPRAGQGEGLPDAALQEAR